MTKTTDEAVMQLLIKVRQKKDEIKKAKKRPQWKTSCTISKDPNSTQGRVNIQAVRDPSKLIDLYAFILSMENRQIAADDLKLEQDMTYLGYPLEEWKDDLRTRAAQISIDQRQKELDTLDRRVNGLVSPDQRREMEKLEGLIQRTRLDL